MPVTWGFTFAAAIAVALHLRKLRRHFMNREAVIEAKINGKVRLTARLLLQHSALNTTVNLLLLVAGAGVLLGVRQAAFALVAIPLVTIVATLTDPV